MSGRDPAAWCPAGAVASLDERGVLGGGAAAGDAVGDQLAELVVDAKPPGGVGLFGDDLSGDVGDDWAESC
jgi:hypothetical protein